MVLLRTSLVLFVVLIPSLATATVGYTSRSCGFDLNADGIIGDPAQDCGICTGSPAADQIYVDCGNGNDASGTGSPAAQYRSIQHAMDTAAAGSRSIICFKGYCHEENLTFKQGGPAGAYIRDGFEFPTTPNMLVGWDANGNGDYPPHDPEDIAVLDGENTRAWAIDNSLPVGFWELAHFSARNYTSSTSGGFMKIAHNGGAASHIYVHDLLLRNINRGQPSASGEVIVFDAFVDDTLAQHVAILNCAIEHYGGGYLLRGSATGAFGESGPYRVQHLSVTSHGHTRDSIAGIKLWGMLTGVEVLDNSFAANPSLWHPGSDPTYAITAAECSRGWTIRNNAFYDYKQALVVDPQIGSAFCDTRRVSDVVFDGNLVRNTYRRWALGDEQIQIRVGTGIDQTVENVTISNNLIASTSPVDACIWSNAGNDEAAQPGAISIVSNTCYTAIDRFASLLVGPLSDPLPAYPQQNYVVENNVVGGLVPGSINFALQYEPAQLTLDGNLYDPSSFYSFSTGPSTVTQTSLDDWRVASGEGPDSVACRTALAQGAIDANASIASPWGFTQVNCRSDPILIPGSRPIEHDCIHEWLTHVPPQTDRNNRLKSQLRCVDDDPTCDAGATAGDRACTFEIALCFNVPDPRLVDGAGASCTPSDVAQVRLLRPDESRPVNAVDVSNRDAIEQGLVQRGGVVIGAHEFVAFDPPLSMAQSCTPFVGVRVPLERGTFTGRRLIKLTASASTASQDGVSTDTDALLLTCMPRR